MIAFGLDAHAQALLAQELERRRRDRVLGSLPEASRSAVREASERVMSAVTEAIVEVAASEPAVADALRSVYGSAALTQEAAAAAPSD